MTDQPTDRAEELRGLSDYELGRHREVSRGFARLAHDCGDTEAKARFHAEGQEIKAEWDRRCAEREAETAEVAKAYENYERDLEKVEGALHRATKRAEAAEAERDDVVALIHEVWAAAIALNCDAAIVADKTYTSDFVLKNIVGNMSSWKERTEAAESELERLREIRGDFEDFYDASYDEFRDRRARFGRDHAKAWLRQRVARRRQAQAIRGAQGNDGARRLHAAPAGHGSRVAGPLRGDHWGQGPLAARLWRCSVTRVDSIREELADCSDFELGFKYHEATASPRRDAQRARVIAAIARERLPWNSIEPDRAWEEANDLQPDLAWIAGLRSDLEKTPLHRDDFRHIEERLFQYILDRYEAAAKELAELKGGES